MNISEDMQIDTELKNAINVSDKIAQYDDLAKRLMGNKIILAHILVKVVDEFKGMNPKDVVPYIEGNPFISVIPIEPGLTNAVKEKNGQRIIGFNTENMERYEGVIRFDIVFCVRLNDGLVQIITNLEAQKDEPSGYDILNRAIFYVSRLVSSQKERDFMKSNYNDIKRVFSIWICMNMSENSMDYIHLTDDKLLGSYQWKGRIDLLNIIMIGIADKLPEHDEQYELHRLLGALSSKQLSIEEKLNIVETEYDILLDENIRRELGFMCNLGEGIRDNAIADVIMNMYKKGYPLEQIAEIVEKSIEEVKFVIRKRGLVLAQL